jgi:ADP-ribose pyrophosphatase YjhB (NUDIX family)
MNKKNIHVLSRGVIIDQDHILLAYDPRTPPDHYYELNTFFYYLPGGHVDFQESAHKALVREIKEETGFEATIEKFLGLIENAWHFPGDEVCCHTHEINLIFKLTVMGLKFRDAVPQKEEHVAFEWIPISSLEETDLRPLLLKSALPKWFEELLSSNDHIMLTATCHQKIFGFIIGKLMPAPEVYNPGGLTLMIDDFCVQSENLWQSVGHELIGTVKTAAKVKGATQILVVCGAHDHPKRKFLKDQNLSIASEWFVGGIV